MPTGAALAISGVAGAALGSSAAKKAAGVQADAAERAAQAQLQASREAAALQLGMFNTIRGDLSPHRDVGVAALPGYYALLGLPPPAGGSPSNAPLQFGASTAGAAPVAPMKAGDIRYDQILKDRPDVLAEYNKILPTVDWNSPWAAQHGFVKDGGPEDFAKWWAASPGRGDYALPTWSQEEIDKLYPQTPPASAAPAGTGTGFDVANIQKYLENLPGYQFTKSQGMDAVRNQQTAKGLGGVSGAYGKGLARFVTGLADQTYGSQLERIRQAVQGGQSAANQTGAFGTTAAQGGASALTAGGNAIAGGITGAANASAAGTIGSASAIGGGINNAANAYLTSRVLGMYSGGGSAPTVSNPLF